jgi:hypothetical protein
MNQKYLEIPGWFGPSTKIYDFLIDQTPDNGIFVECGAWLGRSSYYLCEAFEAKKQNVNIYIVDTWQGSVNELDSTHKLATQTDIFKIFQENMMGKKYNPIKTTSQSAANFFENESCDIVYIDMEHTYKAVQKDIEYWYPKVKRGGWISGHDYVSGWQGVVDAVNSFFKPKELIIIEDSWLVNKK